jgi:Ca-activated chloride channel family protein
MEGQKLADAKEALLTFVAQIEGDQERVGLIEFSSDVQETVPLGMLGSNRAQLENRIGHLRADGNTALLDAVDMAYTRLRALHDEERINAVVVMTDGRENCSAIGLRELTRKLRLSGETGVPVVVFCIAYGSDADLDTLDTIAEATGGQTRRGDPETIAELYKILSSYF